MPVLRKRMKTTPWDWITTLVLSVGLVVTAGTCSALVSKHDKDRKRHDAQIASYRQMVYKLQHPESITNLTDKPASLLVYTNTACPPFILVNYPVLHQARTIPKTNKFMYLPRWMQK